MGPVLVLLRPAEGATVAEVKWWEREVGWACHRKAEVLVTLWCSPVLPCSPGWMSMGWQLQQRVPFPREGAEFAPLS